MRLHLLHHRLNLGGVGMQVARRRHQVRVPQAGAESYWRRPGKRRGHSATFNYHHTRYFYVFTGNAPPFDPDRAYSPFAVYALLECNGDYRAAASALRRLSYGA